MKMYFAGERRATASPVFRWMIAMGCLALFAGAGCRRSADSIPGISIRKEIAPQPVHVGEETVSVHMNDSSGRPVAGASVVVEADMQHPGMSPVFGTAHETTPGSYQARINFNMGGDWVVLLHIKLSDGRKIEQQMDVRGVRSNS